MKDNLFKYNNLPVDLTEGMRIGKIKGENGDIRLKLYPITALAKNLNRSSYTIRRWEKQGFIPKPVFRIKNVRYYTKSQIQLLMYLSMKHDLRQKDNVGKAMPEKFIDEVHEYMMELVKFTRAGLSKEDMYISTPEKPVTKVINQ